MSRSPQLSPLWTMVRGWYTWWNHTDENLCPKKIFMIVWWIARGVLSIEYLPRGQTIGSAPCCSQIDTVQQKHTDVFFDPTKNVFCPTLLWKQSVKWEVLPHPSYSPDLPPCDS